MTSYSSIFAREIPWIEEPGGLQSMGLQRVGHSDKLFTFFFFKLVLMVCFSVWEIQ